MPKVRKEVAAHQRSPKADVPPPAAAVNDRSVAVSLIQALIPLGLKAVEEALHQEVIALASARYAHADGHGGIARWGSQAGSMSACFVRCWAGSRAGSTKGPPRPCLKRSGSRSRACRVASFGRVRRRGRRSRSGDMMMRSGSSSCSTASPSPRIRW